MAGPGLGRTRDQSTQSMSNPTQSSLFIVLGWDHVSGPCLVWSGLVWVGVSVLQLESVGVWVEGGWVGGMSL